MKLNSEPDPKQVRRDIKRRKEAEFVPDNRKSLRLIDTLRKKTSATVKRRTT